MRPLCTISSTAPPSGPQPRWDLCIGSSQHARYLLWASQSPCPCPHSCKQCQVVESFILLVLVALRSFIWILESQSTSIARTKSKIRKCSEALLFLKFFATGFARVLVDSVMTHSQLGLSRHQKGRRPQLAPQNTQVFVPKIKQLSRAEAIALSFVLSKSNRISWWMPLVHFGNCLVKRDDKGKENFLWSESSFCQHRVQGSRILGIDDALRKKKGRRW